MARSIATDLQRTDAGRTATFRIEPGVIARGDARLVRVLLENLIGNAWKYTGDDKRIGVTAKAVAGQVEITVVDNGIGVPWQERTEIFEGFRRGEEAIRRGTPGVGLGLATIYGIVRQSGGYIYVDSTVGRGTIFTIFFPRT